MASLLSFPCLLLSFSLLLLCPVRFTSSEPVQDRSALLSFLNQTPHEQRVNWNLSTPTCSWVGVRCDANQSHVTEVRLPGVGLVGPIPSGTLGRLSSLRVLSLRSNRLSGTIPDDLSNLPLLRSLYLQGNQLSGEIPASIGNLGRLFRLDLSRNALTGSIPFSLNNLTRLRGLFLEENQLNGTLPSISIGSLEAFNVSDNKLNGSIPKSLSRFPVSAFAGNLDLCGSPLPPCNNTFFPPSPSPGPSAETPVVKSHKKKLSKGAIVAIAVGAAALLLLVLLLLLICCILPRVRERQRGKTPKGAGPPASVAGVGARSGDTGMTSSSKEEMAVAGAGTSEAEKNRLVFVGKGAGYTFDLEDLLRASAEEFYTIYTALTTC